MEIQGAAHAKALKERFKHHIRALALFSSSRSATVGRQLARICYTVALTSFHLFFICLQMPAAFSVWIRNCLSVFFCYNTEITAAACASPHNRRGFNFSSALETDFGFSGRHRAGRSPEKPAGGCWLDKAGAFSPFFHFITYANIRLPMSLLQQVCRWWLR